MKASVRLVRFATIGTLNYLITYYHVSDMDCDELLLIQRKIYSSKYYGISHRSNP